MLCWTHPDRDHSIGIKNLLTYTDKNTKVIIPTNIATYTDKLTEEMLGLYNDIIKKSGRHQAYNYDTVQLGTPVVNKWLFSNQLDNKEIMFNIRALAPIGKMTTSQFLNEKISNNLFSIVLLVEIDDIKLLFTGDADNRVFSSIKNDYDCDFSGEIVHYLKIPHHGSEKSLAILDLLDNSIAKGEVACSTVKMSSELPKDDILCSYENYYENVYCTDAKKQKELGIIGTQIDVLGKTFQTRLERNIEDFYK